MYTTARRCANKGLRAFATKAPTGSKNVVLIDGVRIPFALSNTIYAKYLGVDLQKFAFKVITVLIDSVSCL